MSALLHKSAAMGSKSIARSLAGLKGVTKGVCVHLYVDVVCGDIGLFCGDIGLFCGDIGLFCGDIGLF